jgi:hypothetical protein
MHRGSEKLIVNFKLADGADYGHAGPVNFCSMVPARKIRKSVLRNAVYKIPGGAAFFCSY